MKKYYDISKTAENKYNREKAVKYALTYGLNPNPKYRYIELNGGGGGDCSNFISQCLRAGGAPMVYSSPRPWWYNTKGTSDVMDDTWSVSWAVAHSLYWCLKVRGKTNLWGLQGIEVPYVEDLELGDVIQYEDSNGRIYHSAIITDFSNWLGKKRPLITQHTYNRVNISYIKEAATKMHFMKIRVIK